MTFRFLMLSFDYIRPKDPNISVASASLLSYLKLKLPYVKPNIEIHHRRFDVSKGLIESVTSNILSEVKDIKPNIIGTGVYVWNEIFISHAFQAIANDLKREPRPTIILGGPQITYSFKGSLERLYPYANAFIRGYAEESLLKLLITITQFKKQSINGVHYYGDVDKGYKSDMILRNLPSPLLSGETQHSGYIRLETKRGCSFKCGFCQHRDSANKRDNCDISRNEKEIQWIVKENIENISIVDPIFNTPNTHYLQVMECFFNNGYNGRLNLQTRLEMIDKSFIERCLHLMANNVKLELECGIQTVIKDEMILIDRPQSLKRLRRVSKSLYLNEIPFEVSLIYGLPMQTVDSFKRTIQFVSEELRPNRVRAWPLMLLKGTQMFQMKHKYKLREKVLDGDLKPMDDLRQYNGIPHVISSSTFDESDWIEMKNIAQQLNSKQDFI